MNQENKKKIQDLRHKLHAHPELSLKESRTKERLMDFLKKETGLEVTDRGHWFYACCRCGKPEAGAVAFRAEFDALPIAEDMDISYCSQNPGVSHKCGHDGHSAALAGLALETDQEAGQEADTESGRADFSRDVYFIFQHGEEIGAGGEECARLIKEKGISEVYAFHNMSGYPEGSIVIRDGIFQCASKGFTVHFKGTPSHASQPEKGKNPAEAAAELVLEIGRTQKAGIYDGMVLATIVQVAVGEKDFGISAYEGEVSATLRAYYERDMVKMEQIIRKRAEELAERDGLEVSFADSDVFPETVNHAESAEKIRAAAAALGLTVTEMPEPFRASEDFGYYLKQCSGAIFGVGNGEDYPELHTKNYDFNDRILETAVEMLKKLR